MNATSTLQRVFMMAVIATLVLVGLSRGQGILIPLVAGMFVAYLLTAFAVTLQTRSKPFFRMPAWLAYAIATTVAALVILGLAQLIATNVAAVAAAAPTYQANLEGILERLAGRLGLEDIPTLADVRDRYTPDISVTTLVSFFVSSASSLASDAVVIAIYALFFVIERGTIIKKLLLIARSREDRQDLSQTLRDIADRTRTYVLVKTGMSLLVAGVSWIIMALIGIDFAGFWAVLIFVLNFIPYIGSFIAVVFPAALTLVQFESIALFLLAILSLVAAQFVVGSILEPRVMGRSLNLSPVVILMALALWGSIWGVIGAVLCVPLTVIMVIILSRFETTRPIAILLSRDGTLD